MRVSEVMKLIEYKQQQKQKKFIDFRAISKILNKLAWFETISMSVQQQIFNKSIIKVYEKGEVILRQGEQQTVVYVILRGAVEVTTKLKHWNADITCYLKSIYDGAVFGETADQETGT